MTGGSSFRERRGWVLAAAVVVIVQALAATFFLADAVLDVMVEDEPFSAFYLGIELLTAIALVAGVVMGTLVLRHLILEARRRETMVALARGALAELVDARFAEWGLTGAESEVALFALKGCDIAEIARLRGAAAGTVRAQLSRVYDKAGVTSQAMLIGSVIDEFLDVVPADEGETAAAAE